MFKNAASFSLHIEELAQKHRISHMDAVLKYCEENFLEPDDIKNLINKTLKDKIETICVKLICFQSKQNLMYKE